MEALKKHTQSKRLLKVGLAGKALSMTTRGHAPVEADSEVDSGSEKALEQGCLSWNLSTLEHPSHGATVKLCAPITECLAQ